MNNNRTKYASTPTYGMQKRNYAKKQAASQPTPTPDFTQQPAGDITPPAMSFPVQPSVAGSQFPPAGAPLMQNPAMVVPGVQQTVGGPVFMGNNYPMPGNNSFAAPGGMNMAPGFPQNISTPMQNQQPLGNRVPPITDQGFTPRAQGFVPPDFSNGGQAVPPNIVRGDMGNTAAPVPPQLNGYTSPGMVPGAMNGMPLSPMNTQPYPQGGMNTASVGGGVPPFQNNGAFQQPFANQPGNMPSFHTQPYPGMGGGTPAMPTPKPPFDADKWLKILLYGVLPVLFIPCIFITHTFDFLRYAFIILTIITLSVLWYRQSFSSGIRTTISVVYLAMSIIVIAMMVGGINDTKTTNRSTSQSTNQSTSEPAAEVTASALAAQATPTPESDESAVEAEARLSTFMDLWQNNNIEAMVNLVEPSWVNKQDNAAATLFTVVCNRTPQEYTIESISGSSGDSSRTITMSAYIDKNNGSDPTRYRFMILMVKEDGEWYVDPNSLATNDQEEATATPEPGVSTISQSLAPRMTVTPVPAADTKLYYNPDGGSYYHADPNCSAVNSKYLPMTAFLYSELDNPPYSSLLPCLKCGAPIESLGSLESEATATPAP